MSSKAIYGFRDVLRVLYAFYVFLYALGMWGIGEEGRAGGQVLFAKV